MVRRSPKESGTRVHGRWTGDSSANCDADCISEAADACERNYIDTYPYVM